jgi:hypothetical protein
MNTYKKAAINIAFLTIFFTAGISAGFVNNDDNNNEEIRKFSQIQHEKFLNSFENKDYYSYCELIAKKETLKEVVNERIFQIFAEARMAARFGNYDKAISLSEKIENELKTKIVPIFGA